MPCIKLGRDTIVCLPPPTVKLRLADGRRVFMERHVWCGPQFYRDRALTRQIEDWWEDPMICDALDWFQGRGKKG